MKRVKRIKVTPKTITKKLIFISNNDRLCDEAVAHYQLFDDPKTAFAFYVNMVYSIGDHEVDPLNFDAIFNNKYFPAIYKSNIVVYTVTTMMSNVTDEGNHVYELIDFDKWYNVEKEVMSVIDFFFKNGIIIDCKTDPIIGEYYCYKNNSEEVKSKMEQSIFSSMDHHEYEFSSSSTEYEDENLKIKGQIFDMLTANAIGVLNSALRFFNIPLKDVYLLNVTSVVKARDDLYLIDYLDSIDEFINSQKLFLSKDLKFIAFYINRGSEYSEKICDMLSARFEKVGSLYIYTKDEFSKKVYNYLVSKML